MEALQHKAKELLEAGTAKVVIGFSEGSGGRVRPVFVRTAAETGSLIFDQRCRQNLAVYLAKPEVKRMGAAAVVATPGIARTVIQLIAEHQIAAGSVTLLAVVNGAVQTLADAPSLEAYAAANPIVFPPPVTAERKAIAAMSVAERFDFWQRELTRCFKCYACRSACPLCYCERCITDNNQPQWVCVAQHGLGVFEWHLNRAMHLAGRCIECGSCTQACPVGIPIALLTVEASDIVAQEFEFHPGVKCDAPAALSSFRVEDKEAFIL